MTRRSVFHRILSAVGPILYLLTGAAALAAEFHVSPGGDDEQAGTRERPFATISRAQQAAREAPGPGGTTVYLHAGVYYLPEPIVFTAADSGTADAPVTYCAAPGEKVVVSGGMKLDLMWERHRDGILKARTPEGLAIDQLFANAERQPMARYPNFDPDVLVFNGYDRDCFAPERAARWKDPSGGYIHAMHSARWGDMHYRITGKDAENRVQYEGGWQNNRPSRMHGEYRFVENIFEELDAPGEWFHDAEANTLYFYPPAALDPSTATIEVVRLRHLIEMRGTREAPVRWITLRDLTFRHAARTFMENREPLLRSDWTTYRGGAVFLTGAEDCQLIECEFDQVGGNAIFASRYNRRVAVRRTHIHDSGANGVAFVGGPEAVRSPLFNYGEKFDYATIDRTPGPRSGEYPAECVVEDCLITRTGRVEKQTAPVQISMARSITVRHSSIYEVPRAGINISEGTWGGHLIEFCDVFDTVLETGDHGSFNSWGRDRYWHPDMRTVDRQVAADPDLPFLDAREPVILRNNRWRCDHGWDIDLDDGSSNYRIYNNVLLRGGLKMREGYRRIATNNILINNTLHPHCWFEKSGDVFRSNIVMGSYRPARMDIEKWGKTVDYNLFTTSEEDRTRFAARGCDAHSVVGDPMFIDPEAGDFRVEEGSPALEVGFENFPMDRFGVRSPELRAIARAPEIPVVGQPRDAASRIAAQAPHVWGGLVVRNLRGEEYSAFGVSRREGGVLVLKVTEGSRLGRQGVRQGDLIRAVHETDVRDVKALERVLRGVQPGADLALRIRREQEDAVVHAPRPERLPEVATLPDEQSRLILLPDTATLHGELRVQGEGGGRNIGYWNRAEDHLEWRIVTAAGGEYRVTLDYATPADEVAVSLTVAGETLESKVSTTSSYRRFADAELGTVRVPGAGIHSVALRPADPAAWRPINVRRIVLSSESAGAR